MPDYQPQDNEIIADVVDADRMLNALRETIRGVMSATGAVITSSERDAFVDRMAREVAQVTLNLETRRVLDASFEPDGIARSRRMTDEELRAMVQEQIRAELGPGVEFGSGCAGAAIEAMMLRNIHENRRQFDQLMTTTGIKKQ